MRLFIKIFSPFCVFLSILLMIYIFYKAQIEWGGTKNDDYRIYYIIVFLLICFSIFSFFINKKIKEYLIIFSISITFSVYFFESYLVYKDFNENKKILNKKKNFLEKNQNIKYDLRTRKEIYSDLKKQNPNITLTVPPIYHNKSNSDIFPFSGISKSETIFCNESGFYSIYKSDRYGFNNPDYEWDKNEIEFLLVGDSFVHGSCVNRPDDIASVLRKISNKSVLNLGYSSNGPLIEYAVLREYLDKRVKKILWFYYEGNDLENLKSTSANKILKNYLNDESFSQSLKIKQKLINELANNQINKVREQKKFNIKKFLKLSNLRNLIIPNKVDNISDLKKILILTKNLAYQNNSELYFIYLPTYSRYKNFQREFYYNKVKDIVEELEINFIDINQELFFKKKDPLGYFPFKLHGHYTPEGYKDIANTVYNLTKKIF